MEHELSPPELMLETNMPLSFRQYAKQCKTVMSVLKEQVSFDLGHHPRQYLSKDQVLFAQQPERSQVFCDDVKALLVHVHIERIVLTLVIQWTLATTIVRVAEIFLLRDS